MLSAKDVVDFMVRDPTNHSSIYSCLQAARENARAVRGSLTTEVWETHNDTWLGLQKLLAERNPERDPQEFFEALIEGPESGMQYLNERRGAKPAPNNDYKEQPPK